MVRNVVRWSRRVGVGFGSTEEGCGAWEPACAAGSVLGKEVPAGYNSSYLPPSFI